MENAETKMGAKFKSKTHLSQVLILFEQFWTRLTSKTKSATQRENKYAKKIQLGCLKMRNFTLTSTVTKFSTNIIQKSSKPKTLTMRIKV
jgi:hypothetical protein